MRKVFTKKFTYIILFISSAIIFSFKIAAKKNIVQDDLATVKYDYLCRTISVIGNIESTKKEIMTAPLSGIIKVVNVKNGQQILEGENILEIDTLIQYENYLVTKQKVLETRIKIQNTEEEIKRFKRLLMLNNAPEQQVIKLKLKLSDLKKIQTINEKLLLIQEEKIEKNIITAPFSGIILINNSIEKGVFIKEGQQLLSLINQDSLVVQAKLNQDDALKITKNQKVLMHGSINNNMDKTLNGRVKFIESIINNGWTIIQIVLAERAFLKLGSAVKVEIPFQANKKSLLVPIESILGDDNQLYLFKFSDGKIERHTVKVGENDYQYTELLGEDELKEGDKVIISNFRDYEKTIP